MYKKCLALTDIISHKKAIEKDIENLFSDLISLIISLHTCGVKNS